MDISGHLCRVVMVFLAFAATLSSATVSRSTCGKKEIRNYYKPLAAANCDFSLQVLRSASSSGNVFLSPVSISAAMGTLLQGSEGSCKKEITSALCYEQEIPEEQAPDVCNCYLSDVSGGGYQSERFNYQTSFLLGKNQKLVSSFHENVNYNYQATAGYFKCLINGVHDILGFVSGLVGRILGNVERLAGFAVKSVFNFKCGWKYKFDNRKTGSRTFYNRGRNAKSCDFIHHTGKFRVAELDDCSVLELPYEEEGMNMLIILPHEREGLEDLQYDMSYEYMSYMMESLEERQMTIAVPKFNLDCTHDVSSSMQKMGYKRMFSKSSEFKRMISSQSTGVEKIVHQSQFSFSEEGCVSEVRRSSSRGSYRHQGKLDFCADHPFFVSVVHKSEVHSHLSIGCVNSID